VLSDQVFDRRANPALTDPTGREKVFTIDFLDESFPRDRKFPALMGFKESQNLSFEII
jgi:hypothetical protein